MIQTQNPTAKQSQKWILQALLALMQETSYDKISVSEICRKAELDRRTFYRNFDSKNDVLEKYIEQLSDEYMADFHKIDGVDADSAALMFFEFWGKHLDFIKNIQHCGLGNFVFDQFNRFSILQQELSLGRKKEDAKSNYILAFKIGGFWNVMLTWAAHDADISPQELATIISQA